MSSPVPLRVVRRCYGVVMLACTLPALLLVVALLLAQTPQSLRHGALVLSALLVGVFLAMAPLSLLWTWLVLWPRERRRLQAAPRLAHPDQISAAPDTARHTMARAMILLVAGGLVIGALLWTLLNAVGLIGTPMLWLIVGLTNLETARRIRLAERREDVVYYEAPVSPLIGIEGQVVALQRQPC